jgi:hypothetical protein
VGLVDSALYSWGRWREVAHDLAHCGAGLDARYWGDVVVRHSGGIGARRIVASWHHGAGGIGAVWSYWRYRGLDLEGLTRDSVRYDGAHDSVLLGG